MNFVSFVIRIRNVQTRTGSSWIVYVRCVTFCFNVPASLLICIYIFRIMYIFVSPFGKAKFCGVPS